MAFAPALTKSADILPEMVGLEPGLAIELRVLLLLPNLGNSPPLPAHSLPSLAQSALCPCHIPTNGALWSALRCIPPTRSMDGRIPLISGRVSIGFHLLLPTRCFPLLRHALTACSSALLAGYWWLMGGSEASTIPLSIQNGNSAAARLDNGHVERSGRVDSRAHSNGRGSQRVDVAIWMPLVPSPLCAWTPLPKCMLRCPMGRLSGESLAAAGCRGTLFRHAVPGNEAAAEKLRACHSRALCLYSKQSDGSADPSVHRYWTSNWTSLTAGRPLGPALSLHFKRVDGVKGGT